MKQNITKEQWNELSRKQQDILREMFKESLALNIGEMIEYLGDDLEEIDNDYRDEIWRLWCGNEKDNLTSEKELCDVLWEAVKYKLKKLCLG